jgi:hypothetical protein
VTTTELQKGTTVPETLLLDHFVDSPDAAIASHLIVDAPAHTTFDAARTLDLLEIQTPLLSASFWVRGLPAKILHRPEPEVAGKLTLEDDLGLPGWMLLDQSPGHEIVFGAIGVFWTPTIRWNLDVTPADFAEFDEPGWGKIACSYSALPYGDHRTLLTYECRTLTTDADSRRRFHRYWWVIRPFVQHIMNATVRTIAGHAEARALTAGAGVVGGVTAGAGVVGG